jgi:dihydrofolate reductase
MPAMPELLIDFITSLDGYAAAEGWPGWWGLEGPEYLAWLAEQPEADYTVLMGATTYRVMSGFAAEGEPGTDALAGMSKVVFSSTLSEPLAWPNTRLVPQDPVMAVREMKDKVSNPMRTIGSLTLCRSLLKAGLVDRFRVVVFPVITGSSGRERIYDSYPDVALDMISSRTFRRPHPAAGIRSDDSGWATGNQHGQRLTSGEPERPGGPGTGTRSSFLVADRGRMGVARA